MADRELDRLDTVGVVASNGVGYVAEMLKNLGSGRVSVPLRDADDVERLDRTCTREVVAPPSGSGWTNLSFRSFADDEPAQISFTSGTEGRPKAVLLSRRNLHDVVERVTAAMEITSEIREYVGVPVYHSFGYARCRIVLNAGGRCYIPSGGFDLAEIRRMLRSGEINAISAVPTLWRLFLAERDYFGSELEHVRWVEIGSQYMSGEEKQRLRDCLPNARIVQHYGLTEASRATLLRIHSVADERLESVGRAEGDVRVRINERGRIEVSGPNVALGLVDGDHFTGIGPGAWLETSDLGRVDDGWLYFEGRADDAINIGGLKLSPDLLEQELRQEITEPVDFCVTRRSDSLRGDAVCLAIVSGTSEEQRDRLADALRRRLAEAGVAAESAVSVREIEAIPRTPTGKPKRKELSRLLEEAEPSPTSATPATPEADPLEDLVASLFPDRPFDPSATFAALGGDSLLHIRVSLILERALGHAPADWEHMPLGDLLERVRAAGDLADLIERGSSGAPPLPRGDRNLNPPDISFLSLVAEDYRTNDRSIFHQGFLMLLVHRFGNLRMDVRWKLLRAPLTLTYRVLNKLTQILFGMKLDYTVKVGRRVKLEHFGGMILGAREIGNDVILRQNTTLGIRSTDDLNAKPIIGDSVDIGAGAVIVGNIRIGRNSIIGANSVVYANVPPDSVVVGVPGRIIGRNPRQNPSPLAEIDRSSPDESAS